MSPPHQVEPHKAHGDTPKFVGVVRAPTIDQNRERDLVVTERGDFGQRKDEKGLSYNESDATERSSSQDEEPATPDSETSSPRTPPIKYDKEGLPIIIDGNLEPARLLRKYGIQLAGDDKFWTFKLLRHILTRERIRGKIELDIEHHRLDLRGFTVAELVDAIHPVHEPRPYSEADNRHYIRIYALLLLLEKSQEIVRFVQNRQSDGVLPFVLKWTDGVPKIVKCGSDWPIERTRECFRNFTTPEKEHINKLQRFFRTPYFELDEHEESQHQDLQSGTVLPWWEPDEDKKKKDESQSAPQSSSEPSGLRGSFGLVTKLKLHKTSHDFHRVLQNIQLQDELFALKKLDKSAYKSVSKEEVIKKSFETEVSNLRRFSGLHDYCEHLVTLLATFTLDKEYYFLFPWAEYALDRYWEDEANYDATRMHGGVDLETVRWIARQMAGITAAIDTIHDPPQRKSGRQYLDPAAAQDGKRRYGRHGDIKPDNILWFKSQKDPRGILVVSDMGLTAVHRDTSRSNIPGQQIQGGAGYRPPECEVSGGTVNRSFDIWALGCLFLEMMTWLLGGQDLLNEFSRRRTSYYVITGTNKDIFFDLQQYEGNDGASSGMVAVVKHAVTKWFIRLHSHPNCTKFVHEVLEKVENEMLIILSTKRKRSMSDQLRADFQRMCDKCMDNSDLDYATKKVPEQREEAEPMAVQAELAPTMKKALQSSIDLGNRLEPYTGSRRPQPSMTKAELEKLDEVEEKMRNLTVQVVTHGKKGD